MARYIQPQQSQYVSQYVPRDLNFYQQQIDKAQAGYDRNNLLYNQALSKLYETVAVDTDTRDRLINEFEEGYNKIYEKHNGRLDRATGDLLNLITNINKDDFWKLNNWQIEQSKIAQEGEEKGLGLINDPRGMSLIDPNTGKYRSLEELTTRAAPLIDPETGQRISGTRGTSSAPQYPKVVGIESTSEVSTNPIKTIEDLYKIYPENSYYSQLQQNIKDKIDKAYEPRINEIEKAFKEAVPEFKEELDIHTRLGRTGMEGALRSRIPQYYWTDAQKTAKLQKALELIQSFDKDYDILAKNIIKNNSGDLGVEFKGFDMYDPAGRAIYNDMQEAINILPTEKFIIEDEGDLMGKTLLDDPDLQELKDKNKYHITINSIAKVGNRIKYKIKDSLGRSHIVSTEDANINQGLVKAFGDVDLINTYHYLQELGWKTPVGKYVFSDNGFGQQIRHELVDGVEIQEHATIPGKHIIVINGQKAMVNNVKNGRLEVGSDGKVIQHEVGANGDQEIAAFLSNNQKYIKE